MVMKMSINEILNNIGMTKYRLAKLAGTPICKRIFIKHALR